MNQITSNQITRYKMPSINRNSQFFILGVVVLAIVIPAVLLIRQPADGETKAFVSPSTDSSEIKSASKSISYYITTSQEFLNKAKVLTKETPQPKQKIIAAVNQALDLANQAIAAYPLDDRAFAQRANLYQALSPFLPASTNFAIKDFEEAIKLNRQNPQYRTQLGKLYASRGDFNNAALAFYNAYALSPTNLQTLYQLADTLEKSGQIKKADYYLKKLISLLPGDDKNLKQLQARRQRLEAALAQAGLNQLTAPGSEQTAAGQTGQGDLAPQPNGEDQPKIIGTQELPLEQAALSRPVIIANRAEEQTAAGQSMVAVNAKTGTGVISAGETEVTIKNKNVASSKQIVLVPISDNQNKTLFVKAKKAGAWFKAGIDKPIDNDLEFEWWIIE